MKNINDKIPEIELQEKLIEYPQASTIFLNLLYCITAVTNPIENAIKKAAKLEEKMCSTCEEYFDRIHLSRGKLKRKYGTDIQPMKYTLKNIYKKLF